MTQELEYPIPHQSTSPPEPFGLIDSVPGAASRQEQQAMDESQPSREKMHGGYTGLQVGQTAVRISQLQAAGRYEEAQLLIENLKES